MMKIRYYCKDCKEEFKQHFVNTEDLEENAYCPVCNNDDLEVLKR